MYFLVYNNYSMHQINRFHLLDLVKSHSVDACIIALLWIYLTGIAVLFCSYPSDFSGLYDLLF